jgi:hypothetical protein
MKSAKEAYIDNEYGKLEEVTCPKCNRYRRLRKHETSGKTQCEECWDEEIGSEYESNCDCMPKYEEAENE